MIWDVIQVIEWLGCQPDVRMLDIVCADPAQDVCDLATRVAANVLLAFLTGLSLRTQ
jgi:formiminoglutamase